MRTADHRFYGFAVMDFRTGPSFSAFIWGSSQQQGGITVHCMESKLEGDIRTCKDFWG
jgi:hypothetical protein